MDIKLKHRLVGACVILALAVFFLPMILDSEKYRNDIESQIPEESVLQMQSQDKVAEEEGSLTINLEAEEPEQAIQTSQITPSQEQESEQAEESPQEEKPEQKTEAGEEQTDPEQTSSEATKEPAQEKEEKAAEEESTQEKPAEPATTTEEVTESSTEPAQTEPDKAVSTEKPAFEEQAWVIQIGSFSNKDNATGLVAKLRAEGYRAYQRDSDKFSRVYVGPYPDKEVADSRTGGLEKIVGAEVKVIQFDPQTH